MIIVKQAYEMSKRWKTTSLGDVADIQTGPFGSQLHNEDYVQVGTPIITVENLINDSIKYTKETPKVSDEDRTRLSKYSLRKGDIVFSRVGSVDRCAYVSQTEDGWLFSGRLLRVRPKNILSDKYTFYWITQQSIKEFVRKIAVGATMPSINTELLSQIPISFPPIDEQRAIAIALSVLDNKIALLRKQNKTLKTIAQALHNKWFVKFNFPGATGKMVDSELGEIPEGWRVGKLIEKGISMFVKTGIENFVGTKNYVATANANLSNFVGDFEKITYSERPSRANMQLTENSIWFARMAESRKYLLFHHRDSKDIQTKILSTGFAGIKCAKDYLYFYWCFIMSNLFDKYKNQFAEGAVQVAISNSGIQRILLVLPPEEIARKFTETVEPLFEKISINKLQIQTLSALRDTLLPKLMKGEIRIKGFQG